MNCRVPELEVYSTIGEQRTDVDKIHASRVTVRLSAECQCEGRAGAAEDRPTLKGKQRAW